MTDETVFRLVCLSALIPAGLVRDYHWWARGYLSSESRQPLSDMVRETRQSNRENLSSTLPLGIGGITLFHWHLREHSQSMRDGLERGRDSERDSLERGDIQLGGSARRDVDEHSFVPPVQPDSQNQEEERPNHEHYLNYLTF